MDRRSPLGTIACIWRYPVKSLRAERLETVRVERDGLEGDRRRALFVTKADHARSGKAFRGKEHPLLHTLATVEAVRALEKTHELGFEERGDEGRYFDDLPVSLVLDRWVGELERLVGMDLDPLRFRPNFFVRGTPDFAENEAALVGARLEIGDVQLRVVSPIERCVVPSYDVVTGEATPRVLREIVQHRQNEMGVYCTVIVPGTVLAGAAVGVVW